MIQGLRDLNAARQNVTERYVRSCDEIFAVCYIGRAVTDRGVEEVFRLARRANLSNIGIICTKSDITRRCHRIENDRQHILEIERQIQELEFESGAEDQPTSEESRELIDLHRNSRRAA